MPLRPYQEELITKVKESYIHGYKKPCIILPCGGGKSVIVAEIAKRTTDKGNSVLFLVHRKELCDQIVRTFTDWGVDMSLCDVMMVQTACRRISKIRTPMLIITDENHHCLANSYRKIYDAFPGAYFVGVTATPVRLNGDGLIDVNDILITGVSAKWLIENHYLSPYDYYAPALCDLSAVRLIHGEYDAYEVEKLLLKRAIFGDVIQSYKKFANRKQAICYCISIAYSKRMALEFSLEGIRAVHIDGKMPKDKRDKIINDFRNDNIDILCNVDLISEGFDVPDCSCSILLRPTKSLTLYIQQSMRCMRYKDSKKAVIIDCVENYARFGLPDTDRKWTLEKKSQKKIKRESDPADLDIKQCPKCFFVMPSKEKICPHCGYAFPVKGREREIEEEKDVQLTKITEFKISYDLPELCTSYRELREYGKRKGYKPGWAYYKARERGLIK